MIAEQDRGVTVVPLDRDRAVTAREVDNTVGVGRSTLLLAACDRENQFSEYQSRVIREEGVLTRCRSRRSLHQT